MTTKKNGGVGRPAIKSSHERGLGGAGRGEKKPARARTRAIATLPTARGTIEKAGTAEKVRPAGPRKVAPSHARRTDRSGDAGVASDRSRETATAIASAALDKKAAGVEILDVAGKVDYADFLVIMTGRSDRHAQAIAQGIEEYLKKQGVRALSVEGMPHGHWVLMDFGDVVVHVFQDEARQMYDLDGLWIDARRLPVPEQSPPEA